MTEPTIDEMLAWLDNPHVPKPYSFFDAIRAILEQVRLMEQMGVRKQVELEAVRAFVERVGKRFSNRTVPPPAGEDYWLLHNAINTELAAMESEVKNDKFLRNPE